MLQPRIRRKRKAEVLDCPFPGPFNNGDIMVSEDPVELPVKRRSSSPDTIIKYSNIVYRIPANTIKLDFFNRATTIKISNRVRSAVNAGRSETGTHTSPPSTGTASQATSRKMEKSKERAAAVTREETQMVIVPFSILMLAH